tara:strand:- start:12863 stop:13375 length:513 start_codon:yes stop_codon:yes gene_type:complete
MPPEYIPYLTEREGFLDRPEKYGCYPFHGTCFGFSLESSIKRGSGKDEKEAMAKAVNACTAYSENKRELYNLCFKLAKEHCRELCVYTPKKGKVQIMACALLRCKHFTNTKICVYEYELKDGKWVRKEPPVECFDHNIGDEIPNFPPPELTWICDAGDGMIEEGTYTCEV